jgi:DNA-binding NarL/FixJ family response regulator
MGGEVGRAVEERSRVRVLVVDDHQTFTDLVRMALDAEPDLECIGTAHTVAVARTMTDRHRPDVVLMDVNLKAEDGLELAAELVTARPELRVVVLTAHGDRHVMRRAATAGACALLPKDGSLPELLDSLRSARLGEFRVHPALLHDLVVASHEPEPVTVPGPALTPRERRVLELLSLGRDVRTIARDLNISVHTCRGYVKALLAKFGAHSQLEAVATARAQGLLDEQRP